MFATLLVMICTAWWIERNAMVNEKHVLQASLKAKSDEIDALRDERDTLSLLLMRFRMNVHVPDKSQ